MSHEIVSRAVLEQFERALTMFREAVWAFPEEEWKKGETDYLRPAGLAYHVVETMQFYTGDAPANEFGWGGRFGVDWESSDSERLPTRLQLLAYLDQEWAKAEQWITAHDLAQPERLFTWTGHTLLGRMGYLLRHIQHHTAELSLELTRRGYQGPEWK